MLQLAETFRSHLRQVAALFRKMQKKLTSRCRNMLHVPLNTH